MVANLEDKNGAKQAGNNDEDATREYDDKTSFSGTGDLGSQEHGDWDHKQINVRE